MHIFKDCQVVLDLTTSVGFKKKQELRKKITENGGVISYIVTKKSTHVVCNDAEKAEFSYKCKMAAKYNIPVVSLDFIHDSVDKGQLLNTDDFLVGSKNKSEKLSSGTVAVTKSQNVRKQMKLSLDPSRIQVWQDEDKNSPEFNPLTFEVAKYTLLKKKEKSGELMFAVLEIDVANDEDLDTNSENSYKYRVSSHYGKYMEINKFKHGTKEHRFVHTSDEALCVYSYLYHQKIQKQYEVTYELMSPNIGSYKLYEMIKKYGADEPDLTEPVMELVDVIWKEAMGELEEIISVPLQNIKVEQVEEAEAILLRLKSQSTDLKESMLLMAEFYKAIPHNPKYFSFEYSKSWLSKKQDICQLIKDMVSVSEANNWLTRGTTESKYKSLRCDIEHIYPDTFKYEDVRDLVLDSLKGDKNIKIENIYSVQRFVEDDHYRSDLDPKRLLFHSSKVENFVGILSRGLMLPKLVVDDLGGTRTDAGMLGNGIYFASSASTSAKYSKASVTKGTRLMVISEVALGQCMDFYKYDTTLEAPPSGYDSTHGVATTHDLPSEFKDDEYVIYNTNQQRMKYLVEFTIENDNISPYSFPEFITENFEDEMMEKTVIDLNDVKNVKDPMSKVIPGLISTDNSLVELKEIHIRGKLVDLAGEVVVIQEYRNQGDFPIEAKYVFPLDDLAAVCGFEAFINGKHVVGEVKEKETAHKEYKKAISEGHGAYLMDQDEETPDVFTVSVGNLPPGAFVLIKITYVTELQVEGEKISFNVPGSVAPWKQKYSSATEVKDKTWETHQVDLMGKCTVEVAIEMPFDIRNIECTSHRIRIKKTASKAVIAMADGQMIEDGFHLLVSLAEIHVPRMWVESYDGDTDNQACMLTFYPEFEAEEDASTEVVMLLDLSNSMKGSTLTEAKKIILLTLQHLPMSATFNIVAFGTTFKELFPASRLKNKVNMKLAEAFLQSCQANMGNTELYRPLHSFYLLKPESAVKNMYFTSESSYRNIFLVSDGHVNNEETTLEHVYKNSQHTRIFTFGVSSVANRHLLRALARVGAGAFEYFDSKSKSKWENKVKSQISKASQPGLTSVSVAWQQHDDNLPPPIQAPRQITALFNGSRQVIYGFVPNCLMATLYAEIAGQQISTVVSTSDLSVTKGKILHRLTAKAVIRDWEEGVLAPDRTDHHVMKMNMKQDIIELSKKYSIVTKLTSFVAIEKREEGETDKKIVMDYDFKYKFIYCEESVDFLSYMQYEDELQDQEDLESTYTSDSSYNDTHFICDGDIVWECVEEDEESGEYEEEGRKKGRFELVKLSDESSSDEDMAFGLFDDGEADFALIPSSTKKDSCLMFEVKHKGKALMDLEEETDTVNEMFQDLSDRVMRVYPDGVDDLMGVEYYESQPLRSEMEYERSGHLEMDSPLGSKMEKERSGDLELYGAANELGEMNILKEKKSVEKKKKKAESNIEEIKLTMQKNIEMVLDRAENLDSLVDKSCELEQGATTFYRTSRKVHGSLQQPLRMPQSPPSPPPPPPAKMSEESTKAKPQMKTTDSLIPSIISGPAKALKSVIFKRRSFVHSEPLPMQAAPAPMASSSNMLPPSPPPAEVTFGFFGAPRPEQASALPPPVPRGGPPPPPPPGRQHGPPPPCSEPPPPLLARLGRQRRSAVHSEPLPMQAVPPPMASLSNILPPPPPPAEVTENCSIGFFGAPPRPQQASALPPPPPPPPPGRQHGPPSPFFKMLQQQELSLAPQMAQSSPPQMPPSPPPPVNTFGSRGGGGERARRRMKPLSASFDLSETSILSSEISEQVPASLMRNEKKEEEIKELEKESAEAAEYQSIPQIMSRKTRGGLKQPVPDGDVDDLPSPQMMSRKTRGGFEQPVPDEAWEYLRSPQMMSRKTCGGLKNKQPVPDGVVEDLPSPQMMSRKTRGRLRQPVPDGDVEDLPMELKLNKFSSLGKLRATPPGPPPKAGFTSRSSLLSDIRKTAEVRTSRMMAASEEKSSQPPVSWRTCESPSLQKLADYNIMAKDRPRGFKAIMKRLIPKSEESDEDVSTDWNRKVEDYGIGMEVPSIMCGKSKLTIQSIESLLNLQKSDGHWEFSEEFDKLLNINSQICIEILEKAGIKSLGKSIYVEILSLLATIISIYFLVYIVSPELIPLKKRYYLHEGHFENIVENIIDKLRKVKQAQNFGGEDPVQEFLNAMKFCIETTLLHPWVPDILELGPDWFQVAGRMLPGFVEVC